MTHMRIKLLVAGLVLVSAVGYLAFAGAKSGWVYYLELDQFLAQPQYRSERVRIAGAVSEHNVIIDRANLRTTFDLAGATGKLPVAYHGVLPEMFRPGCQVVVEGALDDANVFRADVLLTKCASKYDAADPKAPGPPHGMPTPATESRP